MRYSCPQIELSSEITKNFQEAILDAATFSRLLLFTDNLFEHLPNFQKDLNATNETPVVKSPQIRPPCD